MPLSSWYWIIMFISFLAGVWYEWVSPRPYPPQRGIWLLLLYVLLVIIGIQISGGPVK